jgi:hypothetical protein
MLGEKVCQSTLEKREQQLNNKPKPQGKPASDPRLMQGWHH